ncbi:DNA methyltransferase [Methylobacterium sp. 285MFTsu5.1]|uniref:site-specific DNA-methyltransferase n=1 Tax=Methylobacterium sp. 285MFTsu5.1 TaxID=1172187 RepID=UPI00037D6FDD|nr:DNA methyltransferase [Methylobacterium sp. 285MFTsu5.1]
MTADIETLSPADLRPNPRNARTHPKRQLDAIAASIRRFGFLNPVLLDADGVIIAGHGRALAAKQLGLEQVPVLRIEHLSEADKRAYVIADNKLAQMAGWDRDVLAIELQHLIEVDATLPEVIGFAAGEVDVLLDEVSGGADPDDEAVPAIAERAVTLPGDIWDLGGRHRIACGDARDTAVLAALMGEKRADAVFVDPPYNVAIQGHVGGRGAIRHREFAMASGEMTPAAFQAFLRQMGEALTGVSRAGAVHFICMDWRHTRDLLEALSPLYDQLLNLCVWRKSNAGMGSLYRSQHELVFVFRHGTAPHRNAVELGRHGRNRTNVWDYPSVNGAHADRRSQLAWHPTVKPVLLVADAIKDVTRRGEIVLDSFLGSGTTLIACERAGRRCRGVEIDPHYVDLALRRWSEITGLVPVLSGTGQLFDAVARARRESASAISAQGEA